MHRRVSRQIHKLNQAEEIAYLIISDRIEAHLQKMYQNPLYQEWSASSFRDMLIFGEDTPETQALYKKFKDSEL